MITFAILVMLVAIGALLSWLHWRFSDVLGQLTESIQEGVALEVRRQDERIRKRNERADGQTPDVEETASRPLRAGDPWPGG